MNNARTGRPSLPRACLECQKRKTKCVPSPRSASCTYCARAKKTCLFEAAPSRTPLTRKNLDKLEQKCNRLESLLRSVSRGIDIEAELRRLHESPGAEIDGQVDGQVDAGLLHEQDNPIPEGGPRYSDETREPSPGEEFEWNEALPSAGTKASHSTVGDGGLASMAVASSGYLGSSSPSNMLLSISSLFSKGNGSVPNVQEKRSTPPYNPIRRLSMPSVSLNAALTADANVSRLIDAYFILYNSSYPVLHESSFRKQRERRSTAKATACWTALYHMVLTIGLWMLGEEPEESPYFAVARSWLSARALESGTLGCVQAFLLMGNYIQKKGRPNTGYNMIGIAYRMALGLGMHREINRQGQDTFLLERRRQVFWTLFCFDSGLSITTGRPATIIDAFMDVRMARNIDDSFLDLDSPVPIEVDYPTASSAIITQAHLAIIANEIQTKFWSVRASQVETNHDVALTMEVKLLNWRHSLPRYFTSGTVPEWFLGPRAMVLWKELNLHMMLWRTSQRHHSTEAGKSVADLKCYAAAAQTIKDIAIFCQEHANVMHVGLNWYATYYLFQAILILQLSQLESPPPVQASFPNALADRVPWCDSIEQGRSCLQMLNTGSSAAGRCLETLDRVRGISTTSNPANTSFDVANGQTNGMNPQSKVSVPDSLPEMVSSEPLDMSWSMSADPSLSVLVNDPHMDGMFRGIEGFPGILDQDSFNYMAGYLYDF